MFRHKWNALSMFYFIEGIGSFAFSLIFAADMVYQVTIVGLTPFQLVIVGTTLEVVVFFFEIPTGIIADLYSRRLSLIIGYFMIGVGFIIEGSIPLFGAILLNQLIWGIGVTFTSGADRAWITDEIGEERAGKAYLRASQIGSAGGLLGLAMAALLGSIRVNLPIQVGGLSIIALSIIMLIKMPETGFHPTPKEDRSTFGHMLETLRSGIRVIRARHVLLMVVAVGLVIGLYSEGYDRLNTQHILTNFVFPTIDGVQPIAWISLLRAVSMLLGIFVTEAIQRRVNTENRHALNRALIWSCAPMVVGLIIFGLTDSLLILLAAYWLFNVMRGVTHALYGAWINHYFESNVRATMNSMMGQVDAIGQIAGGPLVGGLAQGLTSAFGLGTALRLTMVLCGIMLSPVLFFFGRALRRDLHESSQAIGPQTTPQAADAV